MEWDSPLDKSRAFPVLFPGLGRNFKGKVYHLINEEYLINQARIQ